MRSVLESLRAYLDGDPVAIMSKAHVERVIAEIERKDAELVAERAKRTYEALWMSAFHCADTKTAEEHADQFMEQNFAEAIFIERNTNWQIIRKALIEAFKVAETRGRK